MFSAQSLFLWYVTDELEASRAKEQELRQQQWDAARAAEADAQRKVEDSYQEASFAVSKALEHLEAARAEAAEARQRAKGLEQAQAEAKGEAKAAKREIGRQVPVV